jgi:excisionase family DNA binding protein
MGPKAKRKSHVTPREAAEICGVNRTTIMNWINKRGLPASRSPGGWVRIDPADLDRFMKKHAVGPAARRTGRYKVLVIDDDPDYLDVMRSALPPDLVETVCSANGEKTFELLEKEMPDLLLLDIMMPGVDGYQVCNLIRGMERYRNLRIVFVSAKTLEEDVVRGLHVGADDYIKKPFGIREARARILKVLGLSAP